MATCDLNFVSYVGLTKYPLLQLREDHKKGIHVENLKEIEVSSARDVIQQLMQVIYFYSLSYLILGALCLFFLVFLTLTCSRTTFPKYKSLILCKIKFLKITCYVKLFSFHGEALMTLFS